MQGCFNCAAEAACADKLMEKHLFTAGGPESGQPRLLGWVGALPGVPAPIFELFARQGYAFAPCLGQEPSRCRLILLDCAGLSPDDVRRHMVTLHQDQAGVPLALLGVAPGSLYEQFVRWPTVKGIFPGQCDTEQLLRGVASIMEGQNWLPRRLLDQWLERQRRRMPMFAAGEQLTDRERQILRLVGDAATNAQIAYDLRISEHTVKTHLYNIFRKIRVRNRTEASNWSRVNFCEGEA